MNRPHQPATTTKPTGEVRHGNGDEAEKESSCEQPQLLEQILEGENLSRAWKQVKANKGAPGVDGMTIEEFPDFIRKHWEGIRTKLMDDKERRQVPGEAPEAHRQSNQKQSRRTQPSDLPWISNPQAKASMDAQIQGQLQNEGQDPHRAHTRCVPRQSDRRPQEVRSLGVQLLCDWSHLSRSVRTG